MGQYFDVGEKIFEIMVNNKPVEGRGRCPKHDKKGRRNRARGSEGKSWGKAWPDVSSLNPTREKYEMESGENGRGNSRQKKASG